MHVKYGSFRIEKPELMFYGLNMYTDFVQQLLLYLI